MLAEPAAQLTLLKLADLDGELARVTHAARSLPQHQRIQSLMEARQQVADELTAATTSADDLGVAAKRAEQDLVPVRARLTRDQARVDDGSVTDPKALRALLEEIEHLGRRISELEDAQLEIMGEAEEAALTRDKLAERKETIEVELREEVRARDEAVASLKEEAQSLAQARGPVVGMLPEPLLNVYERLRTTTGAGAAKLDHGRCGGCRLELTVSDLDDIRKAPANELLRCPECDRILVRVQEG